MADTLNQPRRNDRPRHKSSTARADSIAMAWCERIERGQRTSTAKGAFPRWLADIVLTFAKPEKEIADADESETQAE